MEILCEEEARSGDRRDECLFCGCDPPLVEFEPCRHEISCLRCAREMNGWFCPVCRMALDSVRSGPIRLTLQDKLQWIREQSEENRENWASAYQVMVVGPADAPKQLLAERLRGWEHLTLQRESFSGVIRSKFQSYREKFRSTLSPRIPFSCPSFARAGFNGNTNRSDAYKRPHLNLSMGIRVLERSNLDPLANSFIIDDIQRYCDPDVLILACSAHSTASLRQLTLWDALLRRSLPHIHRVWVFCLEGPLEPFGSNSLDKEKIEEAYARCWHLETPRENPRGFFVCDIRNHSFRMAGTRNLMRHVVRLCHQSRVSVR
mmetsp:Transcript_6932/g.14343  ORF Transcript_6932/g.14343 Transcript_6932/m.14343 type:complete len:318 (-) Transcript_6932:3762-4715(-)